MGYLDKLEKFEKFREENKVGLWELLVADEVSCVFPIDDIDNKTVITEDGIVSISREDAEIICNYIYDWVMDTEATPNEMCYNIRHALRDGDITIEQLDNFDEAARDVLNNMF